MSSFAKIKEFFDKYVDTLSVSYRKEVKLVKYSLSGQNMIAYDDNPISYARIVSEVLDFNQPYAR